MPKIKFSHNYQKLHGQTSAVLLAVQELSFPTDRNDDLIEYDTTYLSPNGIDSYPLPDGTYLQLIFIGNKHIPFCTIRSKYGGSHKNKKDYYESLVWETFQIVITEAENESLCGL